MPAHPDETAIRVGDVVDVASVLELWGNARSLAASLPDDEAGVRALLERDACSLLVAERGGGLVGTLIAGWDGWRGSMYRLVVAPDSRRSGIALRLVAAGERLLRARGARRISAIVGRDEEAAIALWQAAGYEHDVAVERFVKNI